MSRVRSQAPQNGRVTLAITPTFAGRPSIVEYPGTIQVSAGAAPRWAGSGSSSYTDRSALCPKCWLSMPDQPEVGPGTKPLARVVHIGYWGFQLAS